MIAYIITPLIAKCMITPLSKVFIGLIVSASFTTLGLSALGVYAYFNGITNTVTKIKDFTNDGVNGGKELFLWINESLFWSATAVYNSASSVYESSFFSYPIKNFPRAIDMTHQQLSSVDIFGVGGLLSSAFQGANGLVAYYHYLRTNLSNTYTVVASDTWPQLVNVLVFTDSGASHAVGVSLRFVIVFLEHLKSISIIKPLCNTIIRLLESNLPGIAEATATTTT